MLRRNLNTFLVSIITIISVTIIIVVKISGLQIIAGILLTLILPGYAVTTFIFSFDNRLRNADRILITLGMSIILDILAGLILDLFPSGLNTISWVLFLGIIVIVLNGLTVLRKRSGDNNYFKAIQEKIIISRFSFFTLITILISIIIIFSAIEINRVGALNQPKAHFTQLWIRPLVQPDFNVISIGITSFEETGTEFKLQALIDGRIVKEWNQINLDPNQEWENSLIITSSVSVHKIEARLFRSGEVGSPYRSVFLWKGN
jgi:hypothetical protein